MDYVRHNWVEDKELNLFRVDCTLEVSSDDFSTAQITFVNSRTNDPYTVLSVACVAKGGIVTVDLFVYDKETITVPLYKGVYIFQLVEFDGVDTSILPTTTGQIEVNKEEGLVIVTGDGTFTASGIRAV